MLKFNSITFMQFRDCSLYKNLKVNTNHMIVTLIINYNDKTSSLLHRPSRDLVFNSSCFHTLAINPELVYLEKL